jgi:DNA mismatch repair protein MutS
VLYTLDSGDGATSRGQAMQNDKLLNYWKQFKKSEPTFILLIKCGFYYETYYQDAVYLAQQTGLKLATFMADGGAVKQLGIPYHQIDMVLSALLRQGKSVAICQET